MGNVSYKVRDFVTKNRNYLSPEVVHLMRTSGNEVVKFVFDCKLNKSGRLSVKSRQKMEMPGNAILMYYIHIYNTHSVLSSILLSMYVYYILIYYILFLQIIYQSHTLFTLNPNLSKLSPAI